MLASHAVTLQPATLADAALLANLLELYVHDLSEVFPVEIGSNGRFGYAKLSLYWSEPSTHWAFLIRSGLQIAGFAVVTRGSLPPPTRTISTWPSSSSFGPIVVPESVALRHLPCGIACPGAGSCGCQRPIGRGSSSGSE